MQRFIIAVIWTSGPFEGTLSLRTVQSEDPESLEFTHTVGSTWSEEDGDSYRVAALPTRSL